MLRAPEMWLLAFFERRSDALEVADPLPVGHTFVIERLQLLPGEVNQVLVHRAAERRRGQRAVGEERQPVPQRSGGGRQVLGLVGVRSDTAVCTLSLCSVADDRAAIVEMRRVLRPGGQLLLLDHVAATNPKLLTLQRLGEQFTLRTIGDYHTRHPLPLVEQVGFVVTDSRRSKLGTVERIRALKPAA